MQICVVDDEPIALTIVRTVLSRDLAHDVACFSDPIAALDHCAVSPCDLVLIDYRMGSLNGIDMVIRLRSMPAYAHVPVVMLTADGDRAVRIAAIEAGVTDFLNKPFDPDELRIRVRNLLSLRQAQLALTDRARTLDAAVKDAVAKLADREEELIWRLSRAIETRDGSTGQHISRVAAVAAIIARNHGMPQDYCRTLYLATPLHDTGKIGISDAILNKAGRLTEAEMARIRRHTDIGASILEEGESDLIRMAHEIALFHHEKWDGTGYGTGLAGNAIPLSGRIVAVADVFDALCSPRVYKAAWPFDTALAEIRRQNGYHFDPACVAAFEAGLTEIRSIYAAQSDNPLPQLAS
ncbi:putative two-component system response regulator [Loktanella fryxellensis]|uniref:Putative two-component system response regulator n=1 Tax=Loktanella fryxellensis TaxID=245187 RepID=A0A1H8HBR7_9RHOB|nr:HD domain-containing phosphohydrolase [Loktanella fryxellensis]SEN53399.1 putative two-component system response regulator [Loktanella fryxellensis]